MRALVLGSGGREHALAWGLARSASVRSVVCAPGNAGIAADLPVVPVDLGDIPAVVELARSQAADLVVVGPEAPLAAGLADRLGDAGIAVFGPGRGAAQLEASKVFAKEFMARHGIPTADCRIFSDADEAERWVRAENRPLVVKAEGLAAGKGVTVCRGPDEACAAIAEIMRQQRFGGSGARVVIEDVLQGEEASFHVLCDGERSVALAPAQDFKRALDEGMGENTGGMGAYSPTACVDAEVERKVMERIVEPTLRGMREEGTPYRGVLYVGLMIRDGEPSVVEFNVRFGDPETQPLLFRLESDLGALLAAAAAGDLSRLGPEAVRFGPAAVCVVMASEGYPRSYGVGFPIEGLEEVAAWPDVKVFHAGTERQDAGFVTHGGRVLGVTARADSLADARAEAYRAVERIRFKGAHYRRDIALSAAERTCA